MPFIKKPSSLIVLGLVVIIGGYLLLSNGEGNNFIYATVERADLAEEVSVNGRVKPSENTQLAFDRTGRVSRVNFSIGDPVQRGSIIVSLENSDLVAQRSQAEANLRTQEARLDELIKGTRPEELAVYEAKVLSAETNLNEARNTLINQSRISYSRADDAVRNKGDQLFSNPRTSQASLKFTVVDSSLKSEAERTRRGMETILNEWLETNGKLGPDSDLESLTININNKLAQTESLLNSLSLIINNPNNAPEIAQTTIEKWRTDISAARTIIETAISNFSSAENGFKNSKSALELAKRNLDLVKAGPSQEVIDAQKSQVESARANISSVQAQIEKTFIRSPITGVITRQDAKVGEIVSANIPIVSVISDAGFEIEVDVYEGDVVKISIGNPANISLVAFPRKTFKGKVKSISPEEKIIDGVVYYEVTINIEEAPENIKPNMTADIDIQADLKKDVLVIHRDAVSRKEGRAIVEVSKNDTLEERRVEVGIRGANDMVEIISGLEEGEKIIIRQ